MGWFSERSAKIPSVCSCDSCNIKFDRATGYLLNTRQVVIAEAYWRNTFATLVKPLQDELGMSEPERLYEFQLMVTGMAKHKTPWRICEDCSEFFIIDRDTARSYAVRNVRPPRCGKVDPAGCLLFAAAAWEHVTGRWPVNVAPIELVDTCDLCEKGRYAGEVYGTIRTTRMEALRANGIVDEPPRPQRADNGGWHFCQPCLARVLARAHRAGC